MKERREQLESELSAYLDQELPAEQRALIEAWLASDPDAQALLADLQAMRAGLGSLPRARAAAGMMEAIHARIERDALLGPNPSSPRPAGSTGSTGRWAAAAAILLMTSVGGYLVWNLGRPGNGTTPHQQLAALESAAPTGELAPTEPRVQERVVSGAGEPASPAPPRELALRMNRMEAVPQRDERAAADRSRVSSPRLPGAAGTPRTLGAAKTENADRSAVAEADGDSLKLEDGIDDSATTSIRMSEPTARPDAGPNGGIATGTLPSTSPQAIAAGTRRRDEASAALPEPQTMQFGRATAPTAAGGRTAGAGLAPSADALGIVVSSVEAGTSDDIVTLTVACTDLPAQERLLAEVAAMAVTVKPMGQALDASGAGRAGDLAAPPPAADLDAAKRLRASDQPAARAPARAPAAESAPIAGEAVTPQEGATDLSVIVASAADRERMLALLGVTVARADGDDKTARDRLDRSGDEPAVAAGAGAFGGFQHDDVLPASPAARPATSPTLPSDSIIFKALPHDGPHSPLAREAHSVADADASADLRGSARARGLDASATSTPVHRVRLHIRVQEAAASAPQSDGSGAVRDPDPAAATAPADVPPPYDPSVLDLGGRKRGSPASQPD